MIAADDDIVIGIARVQRELRGRLFHLLHHQLAREFHQRRGQGFAVDRTARAFEHLNRFVVIEGDAKFFQDAQRGFVGELDSIGR